MLTAKCGDGALGDEEEINWDSFLPQMHYVICKQLIRVT